MKILAHPSWPYNGTPNEWRGFADLILRCTVSSCGKDITVACGDHDTKDALFDLLTGTAIYQKQNLGPELP